MDINEINIIKSINENRISKKINNEEDKISSIIKFTKILI